ncbi:MAG: lipopolysaccharide assembly protein LapA domain-containing protein [Marinobacter sp.]|nr:lipopolysaccharide assembly protein LapA domain-containing protein [Marinobacter sp.]
MAGFKKAVIALVVIVLVFVALVFSLNNQMAVSLNFLVYQTEPRGVALWVILAFISGALFALLLAGLATMHLFATKRHLQKRLERAERALDKARAEPERSL